MAACEVLERFRVSTLARAYTVAGGRTSRRIGEKYSKKLPAVSGNSGKCSTIVIIVVFYIFEKCVFAIAYNRYINVLLLLFSCYLKLSTNGGRKKNSNHWNAVTAAHYYYYYMEMASFKDQAGFLSRKYNPTLFPRASAWFVWILCCNRITITIWCSFQEVMLIKWIIPFQVLIALRYYASGSFLKVIADTMGVSKASSSRSLLAVSQCLQNMAAEWIVFPTRNTVPNVSTFWIRHSQSIL